MHVSPFPISVLTCLKVMLGYPRHGSNRGEHILNCLQSLSPLLQEDLVELWDAVIPKLLSYLSGVFSGEDNILKRKMHFGLCCIGTKDCLFYCFLWLIVTRDTVLCALMYCGLF